MDGEADTPYEYFMLFIIAVNSVCLGIETARGLSARTRDILFWIDQICLGIFVFDLLFKAAVYNKNFFGEKKSDENGEEYFAVNKWNISDAAIVLVSVFSSFTYFSVFRIFAFFRSLKLIRMVRSMRVVKMLKFVNNVSHLRHTFKALFKAIPGILWTFLFLAIFSYAYAILGTNIFGEAFPEFFGDLPLSLLTLCQVMTFDSWVSGVARPILKVHPYSWIFFVSYSFTSAYVIMNVIVGIIVDFMRKECQEHTARKKDM